jgi:hypothetical protein
MSENVSFLIFQSQQLKTKLTFTADTFGVDGGSPSRPRGEGPQAAKKNLI